MSSYHEKLVSFVTFIDQQKAGDKMQGGWGALRYDIVLRHHFLNSNHTLL